MSPLAAGGPAPILAALSAGRYAAFVWPAYGITALGFGWMILDTLIGAGRWRRKAERLEKRDEP